MKRFIFVPMLFTGIMLITGSCTHDPVEPAESSSKDPCDPDTVYFKNDIEPILASSCALSGCHHASSAQSGVNLSPYNSIIKTGDVEAFSPESSDIYEMITEEDPAEGMPPGGQLPQAQIDAIFTWIAQGVKNNQCSNK